MSRTLPIHSRAPAPGSSRATRSALALLVGLALASCGAPGGAARGAAPAGSESAGTDWGYAPDLQLSQPPFERMHVDWKHRLDQPYVYIEHQGSYLETGHLLGSVQRAMVAQGLRAAGPPFALFYDDPGATPIEDLRSRACIPVAAPATPRAPLAYDVLPSTTVVYAVVGGAYPEVPRSYPGLYRFIERLRWVEAGPIREIYLVRPDQVEDWSELRCEVQIPVRHADG